MEVDAELISRLRAQGLTWREIGKYLAEGTDEEAGLMQERARSLYRRAARPEEKHTIQQRRSTRNNRDGSKASELTFFNGTPPPTDEEGLLLQHGYDPRYWRVLDSSATKRGQVWSSRVKVAPREIPELDAHELRMAFTRALSELENPVVPPRPRSTEPEARVALIALYDVHYGRRGVDGSDHRRTEQEVRSVITTIAARLKETAVREIVLTIGQDFLNADNVAGSTTGGTPQDNSLAWHDMMGGGLALAAWTVDTLAEIAPTRVIYSEGNHDRVLSWAIVQALGQRYMMHKGVLVDERPEPRKYLEYGRTLIGLSHGKDEANLSTVMQIENPEAWGRTTNRYWFLGHLHHLEVMEKDGVTIVRCPSMAFSDDWTRRKGFVGSEKSVLCALIGEGGVEDVWLVRP